MMYTLVMRPYIASSAGYKVITAVFMRSDGTTSATRALSKYNYTVNHYQIPTYMQGVPYMFAAHECLECVNWNTRPYIIMCIY